LALGGRESEAESAVAIAKTILPCAACRRTPWSGTACYKVAVKPLAVAPSTLSADFERLAGEVRAAYLDDLAATIARLGSYARPGREA
jgi:hypothetical protein